MSETILGRKMHKSCLGLKSCIITIYTVSLPPSQRLGEIVCILRARGHVIKTVRYESIDHGPGSGWNG